MNLKNPSNTSGFTLLEILIAIFTFSVILSTIFISYTGTFRLVEDVESQSEFYGMARTTLERISEDLESVYISKSEESSGADEDDSQTTPFVGQDMEEDGREADTLRFFSSAHIDLTGEERNAGIAQIVYRLEKKDDECCFTLYRSDSSWFGESSEEGTGEEILCNRLYSFNLTYHDTDGSDHKDWNSESDDSNQVLPSRITIEISFKDVTDPESAPLVFKTGVALPITGSIYEKTS